MHRVTLARNAMATRFEVVLAGENPVRLRAAGEEALDEIERIEALLSLYRPASEIAQINARAAKEAVRVSPEVFQLLSACKELCALTEGAFDVTVAPLVRCWGFMEGGGARPSEEEIARARESVGIQHLELDADRSTARFARPGMMLDLGSIGKGYAIDAAAEILQENGVAQALLHGGTSTIRAMGGDLGSGPWKVAIELPANEPGGEAELLSVANLENESLSVSAVWGKHFEIDGEIYGHIIDPRTGWPARAALLGASIVASSGVSDALSTGVLLGEENFFRQLEERIPNVKYLQVRRDARRAHKIEPVAPARASELPFGGLAAVLR